MGKLITKLKIYGPFTFAKYAISETYRRIWFGFIKKSFSQNAEDLAIHKLLGRKKRGFYVDVGASDPTRFNNTKYFYLRGWRGINIEPDLHFFAKLESERKRDVNLNIGIGNSNAKPTFYRFFPDTLSTFSEKYARKYEKEGYILVEKIAVQIKKLSNVLARHLKGKRIDFMTIDTEGYDKEVLLSNNWSKYRPRVICIESTEKKESGTKKGSELNDVLKKLGYRKHLDNGINSIYVDVTK